MAYVAHDESELHQSVLGALNLSLPTNPCKLRQILAEAAITSKTSHKLHEAAAAAANCTPLGPQRPPGFFLPNGFAPPPGLAPPAGLVAPSSFKARKCQDKATPVDDYIESDAEGTSIGTGCNTSFCLSDREESTPQADKVQSKANASCFQPTVLSNTILSETSCRQQQIPPHTPLRQDATVFVPMSSAHEITGTTLLDAPIKSVKKRSTVNRFTKTRKQE